MTVFAFVEATKVLRANSIEFVLTNKLFQDSLEEHFARHLG